MRIARNLWKEAMMRLLRLTAVAVLTLGALGAHAAPTLGVGDCVGPKIVSSRQLPGNRTAFNGTPAPLFATPGGAATGQAIAVGETYLVTEVQRGFLHLKASVNSGKLAPGTVVGWVAASSVGYFWGPRNCE
jgi:hypothetical protein